MIIRKKSRNILKKIRSLQKGKRYYLAIGADGNEDRLQEIGFRIPLNVGDSILPSGSFGPACMKNASGYEIIHKDQKKETAFRQIEWHWEEFHGRHDTVSKSKIVDVPYQRYPRTKVPPFSFEISVQAPAESERLLIVSGPFVVSENEEQYFTNSANMFIELFGYAEILDSSYKRWSTAPIRKLNWELLPPGENPWKTAQKSLKRFIERAEEGNQPVIRARFDKIGRYSPDFIAVGLGGFSDYVIFGFRRMGICILESQATNNATYIIGMADWEKVSAMSKAEILNNDLHIARLIHRVTWMNNLSKFFLENDK